LTDPKLVVEDDRIYSENEWRQKRV